MAWSDAIAAVAQAFREVFGWKSGGRTQEENRLRAAAEAAQKEHDDAIDSGDAARIAAARTRQRELLDEASSKRP